jgi:DoxX-like family
MTALTIIVTVATALVFLAAAAVKFAEQEHAMQTRDRLAIRPAPYRLIGVFEVAGAVGAIVGLAVRPLGIAALTGLVLIGLGACAVQVRLRNSPTEARPAVVATLLAVTALALQIATA